MLDPRSPKSWFTTALAVGLLSLAALAVAIAADAFIALTKTP